MQSSEKSQDVSEQPSTIVRIAYHQLSIMRGIKNLAVKASASDEVQLPQNQGCNCTSRLVQLPLVVSITSAFSSTYANVKKSNPSVTELLNGVEDLLCQGIRLASPVTGTVASVLETPLKSVDNAICAGLDYLGESVPLSSRLLENIGNYIRAVSAPPIEACGILLASVRSRLSGLAIGNEETSSDNKKSQTDSKSNN